MESIEIIDHCINLNGTENLGVFGGESGGYDDYDSIYFEYGLDFGSFKVFGLKPEQMSKLGCEIINHLIVNGHRFDIGKTGWPDTIEEIN